MAELVDAQVSGTCAARREGSSPFLGTIALAQNDQGLAGRLDNPDVALELAESLADQEMLGEAAAGLQAFLAKGNAYRADLPSLLGLLRDELEEYPAAESAHRAALAAPLPCAWPSTARGW